MIVLDQFRDAIRAAGLTPPDAIVDDGKLHRFAPNGKRHDDAGWYILHGDGIPAGIFGDWRQDFSQTWRADIGRPLSPAEQAAHRERIRTAQQAREADDLRRKAEAATTAATIWKAARPAPADHPYLLRKGIKAHGARLAEDGRLIIPLRVDGALHSLQYIGADGEKRFLPGGRVAGCYFGIGATKDAKALCIAEGFATGASVYEATGHPVACAMNAGNLEPVALALRAKFPDLPLILCADDDHRTEGNPGVTKANAAALAVGGKVAIPVFGADRPEGATDLNDLHQARGLEAVNGAVEAAAAPEDIKHQPAAAGAPAADPSGYDVTLIRGDSIEPEAIRWIWNGWLAAGKFHVLAGSPGVGKSTIALALAATITSGGRWPDGTRAAPGNVLIWSGEDDPADTLVPRLIASGADMARIWVVGDVREGDDRVAFDPARHMGALELQATRIGGVALVMVDPVVSAVAGDSHKNAEVRRSLQPLVDLATRLDCAMLGISHFTKGTAGRDPTERVTGSLAFGALARIVLVAAKLPADDGGKDDRILARAKCNIGIDVGGFGYSIEQTELDTKPGLFASRVLWGEAIDGTARELLADAEDHDDVERTAIGEAADFLRDELAAGAVPVREIQKRARAAGIADRTLRRAKAVVGADNRKNSYRGGWEWYLRADPSPKMAKDCEDGQTKSLDTFDRVGHLPDCGDPKMARSPEDVQQNSLAILGDVGHLGDGDDVVEVEF
jgi:putative DNA primase/helicase